jgi:hypothetical protein
VRTFPPNGLGQGAASDRVGEHAIGCAPRWRNFTIRGAHCRLPARPGALSSRAVGAHTGRTFASLPALVDLAARSLLHTPLMARHRPSAPATSCAAPLEGARCTRARSRQGGRAAQIARPRPAQATDTGRAPAPCAVQNTRQHVDARIRCCAARFSTQQERATVGATFSSLRPRA